jgi:uncharacterized protein (TIGR02246 family)
MRRWLVRFGVLAVLVMLCAPPGHAGESSPEAVDAAWVKAMKANDVDAVMKCYAPDAVAWLPGAPTAQGEKAIRASYEGLLSANTVMDAALSNVREKAAGDWAVRWGDFSMTLAPKSGGAPVVMIGRFTEVLERRAGGWVYTVDHASPEPPAMAGTK